MSGTVAASDVVIFAFYENGTTSSDEMSILTAGKIAG
jgi:hypothetical protein